MIRYCPNRTDRRACGNGPDPALRFGPPGPRPAIAPRSTLDESDPSARAHRPELSYSLSGGLCAPTSPIASPRVHHPTRRRGEISETNPDVVGRWLIANDEC